MTRTARRAVAALAMVAAGMGVGIGLANAQTEPTTPPTTAAPDDGATPEAPATPGDREDREDRENCPEKDGAGGGRRARPDTGSGGATSL